MSSKEVTINAERRLFVIPSGDGYSCFGFDNCFKESKALAEALKRPDLIPAEETRGTLENFRRHRELVGLARNVDLGTWFNSDTPQKVRRILEDARQSGERLKITLGDAKTGEAWGDRPEAGYIGRSGGTLKVPLLIPNRRSHGGGAILDACIVRIETSRGGTELYRHPTFKPYVEPVASAAEDAEPEVAAPAP